jgi:predicted MPP superfamily phosphohydrolase
VYKFVESIKQLGIKKVRVCSQLKQKANSRRRLKEWELNPFLFSFWQRLFHFELYEYLFSFTIPFFKLLGLYHRGFQNALNIRARYLYLRFANLPEAFDGFRILFIADLHADRNQQVMERLIRQLKNFQFDLVLLGGDYRFKIKGLYEKAIEQIRPLKQNVDSIYGWYAVLGNHDPLEIIEPMEELGIHFLVNENIKIDRNGQAIWLIGLDEEHYFESANFAQASQGVPQNAFSIVLTHANDALLKMPANSCDLFLCGHTHGGQICFPFIGPLLVHSRLPRNMANGLWNYRGITGFTTCGVGTSGLPLRFNCPGEYTIIKLKSAPKPRHRQDLLSKNLAKT